MYEFILIMGVGLPIVLILWSLAISGLCLSRIMLEEVQKSAVTKKP